MASYEIEEDFILFKMNQDASKRGRKVLALRPYQVTDFSSQYGCDDSISYTAENIIGPPTIYPHTGDNAYSYQLRTYGEWWSSLPSSKKRRPNLPHKTRVESQDFVEFRVERRILPQLIRIYEIYSPGSIVKIFAYCYNIEKWVVLWQGDPKYMEENKSNCFTMEFHGVTFYADLYRIEFYHKHLSYFSEIDGLILYGEDVFPQCFPSLIPESTKKSTNCLRFFFPSGSSKDYTTSSSSESRTIRIIDHRPFFDILPVEVIYYIISFLDLQSLCILSQVSRLFRKLCCDPVLYKVLNLKLYWHLVDSSTLKSLIPRLNSLKELDLSWCGSEGRIKPGAFIDFVESCCQHLTSIKLSNCKFVNNNALKAISNHCPLLKELTLQNCRNRELTTSGYMIISQMKNVTYLDLYRTMVDKVSLIAIIQSLKLEHLFLGGCSNIVAVNEIAQSIGKHLKNTLKTLDLWRATTLHCAGVYELSNCVNLVELDLGWCNLVDPSCGCLKHLITCCPKLKKIFLTSLRTLSSLELNALATHCPDLEQLDILGTNKVNVAAIKNLLQNCKNMKLLDISYCDCSMKYVIEDIESCFPHVKIKCNPVRTTYQ